MPGIGISIGLMSPKRSTVIDTDLAIYLIAYPDTPSYAMTAANNYITGIKAAGLWSEIEHFPMFLPTESMFNFYDMKTHTTDMTAYSGNTLLSTPWLLPAVWTGSLGLNFTLLGETRNSWIPSDMWTLNSSAYLISYPTEADLDAGYSFGCSQGATQSVAFIRRSAADNRDADMYGTTVGTGRLRKTTAGGAAGVYVYSRTSSTAFNEYVNGVNTNTGASTQGSLPTVQTRFNNLG